MLKMPNQGPSVKLALQSLLTSTAVVLPTNSHEMGILDTDIKLSKRVSVI